MLNLAPQLLEQGKVQQALPLLAEQCENAPAMHRPGFCWVHAITNSINWKMR
ncbi:MAG: hypothetical protein WBM09_08130 [Gallionella sp.]